MYGPPQGHQMQPVQPQGLIDFKSGAQVADMNRVESATKKTDHSLHQNESEFVSA